MSTAPSKMAGIKRKDAPGKVVKKDSKKAKIESDSKPTSKKHTTMKTKSKQVSKSEQSSGSKSEDSSDIADSEGGVPLVESASEDSEQDVLPSKAPKIKDGLHPERAKAVIVNSQSSKEAHMQQKKLAQERKAAKPLADQLARTKKIWERLRRKSHVPREEREELVSELFDIITGRVKDFVLKHDSVRVIQTAIKYANPEQKRMIAKELAGTYPQLAESKYAKFLIGKLLVHGDKEIRDLIVPEFFGHVRRLIKHAEASWILDDIYRGVATKQQKAIVLREWYGAEFALFKKDISDEVSAELSDILTSDPGKRAPIMRSLQELINHLIQKKMTGFTLLHDAMLQYFLNAKPGSEEITEYIELIKGDEEGDLLKNLAFTRSGARVVCLALAYGNAKDRKHILRAYKDTLQLMASDPNGHIVILTAYEVIDDTILTAKAIFPELLSKDADKQSENVVVMTNDLNARTTLLYLYQGRSKALFPPSHSSDLEILAEIDVARSSTSKKDHEVRRSELAKALSPYLLPAITAAVSGLVTTSFGCQLITEVMFGADGDKSAALKAVAQATGGDPSVVHSVAGGEAVQFDQTEPQGGNASWRGKMLKALIAGGRFDRTTKAIVPVVPALNFADTFYPLVKDHIVEWATGPSPFVILALLECATFSRKGEVLRVLKENKKKLQKAATEETATQRALREAQDVAKGENHAEATNGKGKKKKFIKKTQVGNRGTALLLEQL